MPDKPLRPCNKLGCSQLTRTKYCDKHQADRDAAKQNSDNNRESSARRGYDRPWRRYREQYLAQHPWCECERCKGKYYPASVVDHIVPHKGNKDLFWDPNNHQALAKRCHDRKTASEDGGFGRVPPTSKKL